GEHGEHGGRIHLSFLSVLFVFSVVNQIRSCGTLPTVKIGLVILHGDAARGGAERYTLDVAAALVGRGHDVAMIASSFGEVDGRVRRVSFDLAGLSKTRRYLQFLDQVGA